MTQLRLVMDDENWFNEFWDLQIRKVNKAAARREFLRKVKGNKEKATEIILGWKRQRNTFANTEIEYVPHPRTWLYNERWEDEIKRSWDQEFMANKEHA